MDKEIALDRFKQYGFLFLSTLGWLVLSFFSFYVACILLAIETFIRLILAQIARWLGFEIMSVLHALTVPVKFVLFKVLDAAKIKRPQGLNPNTSSLSLLRLVWWHLAKPNKVTFIVGCIAPFLALFFWLTPATPEAQQTLQQQAVPEAVNSQAADYNPTLIDPD
ncbi:hypothetical protein [Tolypothrix sp. VBCCA 56010]|uniref:hypothetical protein n=1 Tax=Tolypothrix sp. VBCCA 56010 TaxID=3137731 RepID=UPI003D7CCBB7